MTMPPARRSLEPRRVFCRTLRRENTPRGSTKMQAQVAFRQAVQPGAPGGIGEVIPPTSAAEYIRRPLDEWCVKKHAGCQAFRHPFATQERPKNNFAIPEGDSPISAARKSAQSPSCFSAAPRLLADGVDIPTVQELLGHKALPTTQIYTHVLKLNGLAVRSPADRRRQFAPAS
jgi:integrase